MSQNGLRAIKTQLSGSGAGLNVEDGPGTRSGRRSARGRSQPFFIGVAGVFGFWQSFVFYLLQAPPATF